MDSQRNISSGDSRQQSLQQRKSDHASHHRSKGWFEEAAQSIKKPEHSTYGESEDRFGKVHGPSCESACDSAADSLCILVGLHHAKKISFGVLEVCKITYCWDRGLGHN